MPTQQRRRERRGGRRRELEPEARAAPGHAVDADLAAHGVDQDAADGQAQARAGGHAPDGDVGRGALEQQGLLVEVDADTGVDDLEALLRRDLDPDESVAAELYIDNALGEIEAYLGRFVTPTEVVDEQHYPDADGVIILKWTPIISIDALSIDGDDQDLDFFVTTTYGFENIWDIIDFQPGPVEISGSITGEPTILVSYTAGYGPDHPCPRAARSMIGPGTR
mgnify:CR=1 FL=1